MLGHAEARKNKRGRGVDHVQGVRWNPLRGGEPVGTHIERERRRSRPRSAAGEREKTGSISTPFPLLAGHAP
jgi:hypothetical protein